MNKKYILSLIFIWLVSFIGLSQNTYVPDDNFEQALIDLGYDSEPLDDYVPTANIVGVTNLDIQNLSISDLTGIEDFTALTNLNCDTNNLTSLDISQNINLTQLYCRYNSITSLDVSNNTNLNILWVDENQLTTLDVSKNIDLISLITNNNPLNTLDISKNIELNVFSCEGNQLNAIDVSKNIKLNYLNVNYNSLTTLNVSKNTELTSLACGDNLITSLDLTKNQRLEYLFCARIPISSLDVTKNTNLQQLVSGDNQISSLDLSKNTKLKVLWCARNFLSELDLSNNLLLESFLCAHNNLRSLDLTKNKNLREFECDYNPICYVNLKNGNNNSIINYSSIETPNLSCIFVDNVVYSNSNWSRVDPVSNFVTSQSECDAYGNSTPPVDTLNDFIGTSYTLPILSNGNYFTESGGNGTALYAGNVINISQTIYVFSDTGCYTNETSFNVIITQNDYYIPKFFTPNNDGSHDTWQVLDNSNAINFIHIYDRYGKLLKSLLPNSDGWNGIFNGQLMESNDYWYAITLNSGDIIKGHFTLKR
ncbi:T9SS type B sorting domain-containing protein [Flavobacteriaceae bacterium XHP0103]|uniref:T9SS type B sorting domain-containing protein n=1 Tax=Marixanthotalea marina TaxID=2844359 RepID=UPI002989A4F4|nr:T9SS type B sorting domain-containing protein [Marixanthotalea marina]MBU3820602.1 T9SS type B sorting domain-containing protein [Marixanthotalea marina]